MADYRPPLRDIDFVLDDLVDLDELCQLDPEAGVSPDDVKGLIAEYGRFVAEVFAPLNRIGDEVGSTYDPETRAVTTPPGYVEAYQQFVAGGWGAIPFPATYGGGALPWLVNIVNQELMSASNMGFATCPMLLQGAIDMLLHHGSEEQREVFLPKMVSGEWTGTMNLTESEAGSDVGALRTKAVRQDDGTYRITGQKIFITFGDHDLAENIIHLVLARTPDAPPGTKGISCFIVPKFLVNDDGSLGERNDAWCVSIEHKMGIRVSPTCVMSYGDAGEGAVGYLIGEENQGMRYMFTMMNNARLSVGLEGLAVAERAYQDALQYAQERRQGRAVGAAKGEASPIVEHADVRRMLMTMKAYIEAMRGLVYITAEAIDISTRHPDPGIREPKHELLELLIPVVKAWCTDLGSEVASLAIQVWGGMGYIEESGVAQHYRDARISAIYEGTNGIQAMDLVGRKLPMRGGGAVKDLLGMIAMLDPALSRAGDELEPIRTNLGEALTILADTTNWIVRHGVEDPLNALAGATPYLRMFGLTLGGWVMARRALAAADHLEAGTGDAEHMKAQIVTARFYCEQLLPGVKGLVSPVTSGYDTFFALTPEYLAN